MKIQYRRTTLTREAKRQIATDYNAGMAVQTITQKYGIGRSTLYKVLRDISSAGLATVERSGEKGGGV